MFVTRSHFIKRLKLQSGKVTFESDVLEQDVQHSNPLGFKCNSLSFGPRLKQSKVKTEQIRTVQLKTADLLQDWPFTRPALVVISHIIMTRIL